MHTVLVVDDAEFMRIRCARILDENGYAVAEATNGSEAVEIYRYLSPAAVLLDISMPTMNGMAALRTILAMDPTAKIIMLTAMGQQQVVIDAVRAGAKDFIVKPFKPERVLYAVRKLTA